MKLSTDKCHLLVLRTKYKHSWAKIGDDKTWESNEVKLLGIAIDSKLSLTVTLPIFASNPIKN